MCQVYYIDTNTKIVTFWEKDETMNEIVLTHNGISYTKEDIIKMLDLVMEIVGEEV